MAYVTNLNLIEILTFINHISKLSDVGISWIQLHQQLLMELVYFLTFSWNLANLLWKFRVFNICTSILTCGWIVEFKSKETRKPTSHIGQEHNYGPKECTMKRESKWREKRSGTMRRQFLDSPKYMKCSTRYNEPNFKFGTYLEISSKVHEGVFCTPILLGWIISSLWWVYTRIQYQIKSKIKWPCWPLAKLWIQRFFGRIQLQSLKKARWQWRGITFPSKFSNHHLR